MTHLDDETLSALIDSELPEEQAAGARAHAAECPACAARLERLRGASAAFRRQGEEPLPPEVSARVRSAAPPVPRRGARRLVLAAAVAAAAVLMAGMAMRTFMPTLFNNVQQMITGAASQMGSGGK